MQIKKLKIKRNRNTNKLQLELDLRDIKFEMPTVQQTNDMMLSAPIF